MADYGAYLDALIMSRDKVQMEELQTMNGWGLGHGGCESSLCPLWPRKPSSQLGSQLDSPGGVVGELVLDVCPDSFGRVEFGGVGGLRHDGQPVGMRGEELPHGLAAVCAQIVPAQDDRGVQLMVRGVIRVA